MSHKPFPPKARKTDAYLALTGDIYSHLGDSTKAAQIFKDAIRRNPTTINIIFRSVSCSSAPAISPTPNPLSRKHWRASPALEKFSGDSGSSPHSTAILRRPPIAFNVPSIFSRMARQLFHPRRLLLSDRPIRQSARSSFPLQGQPFFGGFDVSRIEQALATAPQTSAAARCNLFPSPRASNFCKSLSRSPTARYDPIVRTRHNLAHFASIIGASLLDAPTTLQQMTPPFPLAQNSPCPPCSELRVLCVTFSFAFLQPRVCV